MNMTYHQVLNGSKLPASGPYNDLAIFRTRADAEYWITYLVGAGFNYEDEYSIREVVVSLPLAYPGEED